MSRGYVYILINAAMPGLVKIGMTHRDPAIRCREISDATGVPVSFEVYAEVVALDCAALEATVHHALQKHRVNPAREFFAIDASLAEKTLREENFKATSEEISDVLPWHQIVPDEICVSEADICLLAEAVGAFPEDVACAFGHMEPEDLKPALDRLAAYRRRPCAQMEAPCADTEAAQ